MKATGIWRKYILKELPKGDPVMLVLLVPGANSELESCPGRSCSVSLSRDPTSSTLFYPNLQRDLSSEMK